MHSVVLRLGAALAALAAGVVLPRDAAAQASISFVCSAQEEYCRALTTAYERAGTAKIAMVRKSTGEAFAQVKAEASNPKIDLWWGCDQIHRFFSRCSAI